jgi:hypothetical protein
MSLSRSIQLVALVVAVTLAFAPLAVFAGHHVNGTWVLTVDLGGQGGDATFELEEKEAGKLMGSYSGAAGTAEVSGTVDGNKVAFSFQSEMAGTVSYEGTVDGDTMEGTCSYGELGSGTFTGSRKAK